MGRPKKKACHGHPGPREKLIRKISVIAPFAQSITPVVAEYLIPPTSPLTLADVECTVCLGVLVRPIQLHCGQNCCTVCLRAWVKHTPILDPFHCPCCPLTHTIHERQLLSPPQVLMKLLDTLHVRCRRCLERVAGAQHLEHLESGCKLHIVGKTRSRTYIHPIISCHNSKTISTGGRVRHITNRDTKRTIILSVSQVHG